MYRIPNRAPQAPTKALFVAVERALVPMSLGRRMLPAAALDGLVGSIDGMFVPRASIRNAGHLRRRARTPPRAGYRKCTA